MSMYRIRFLPFVALALLLGCGSTPPTEYYVLSADAPIGRNTAQPSIGIAELQIAEYLQRPEIMVMESTNRARLDGFERWAEPLDDGIRRTLALNLGALLETDSVRVRPWPRDWIPDWVLRCTVARLDASASMVELVAIWSLQRGAVAAPVLERSSRLSRARSGSTADSLAADFSALLLELSQQIATAMHDSVPPESAAQTVSTPAL